MNSNHDGKIFHEYLIKSDKYRPYQRVKHNTDIFYSCAQHILNSGESLNICKAFQIGKNITPSVITCFPRPVQSILGSAGEVNLLLNHNYLLLDSDLRVDFHKDNLLY